ncbi:hypothetical protein [Rhabdothermincola salaria]|uniref:hypothetical protein n=1 Tax=Rhabdothermincola salaria TaxID=2903142 RepID=UPI001E2A854F|nr:hypothetical protein [Rhabdothermincola salaria]MCD9623605.1 hypothetical protein [Rhabdothermincola salaria]
MAAPPDRLLPWWLERQLDPTGPDVVPGPAATVNTTHRDWVLLGTVGAPERAVLDPRGLLTPWPAGWSLDWWVGADDRWHLPSRASGVRQNLLGDAPVVETAMRVPSGDLRHRAWAVAGGDGVPPGGAVVVELENASPVPVAIALAVRPWNPLGASAVHAVDLEATTVTVDSRVALVLPKAPSRVAFGDVRRDAVESVLDGTASGEWPEGGVRCTAGAATAAFLFPLPHTAVLRVVVPLASVPVGPGRRRSDATALAEVEPRALPGADRVVSGWEAQVRRAARVELPEPRVAEALAAARRHLLLHTAGDDAGAWPPVVVGGLDTSVLAVALDRQGLHTEAERLLVGFADRQALDGSFGGETHRGDAAGAWLHAVAEHVRLTGGADLAVDLVGPVAKAAHHLQRRHLSRRARRSDGGPSLLPAGDGPGWVGDDGPTYHDALWAWRGLLDASFTLEAAAQPDAASEVAAGAAEMAGALAASLTADATATASLVPLLGPGARMPAGAVATVAALASVLCGPGAPPEELAGALAAGAGWLAEQPADTPAVWHHVGHAGQSPRLTAAAALADTLTGRADTAISRLRWLLDRGAPLWTWPEHVHPRTGGGSGGQGHDAAATAGVIGLIRALAVVEVSDGLALAPAVPAEWYGREIEVHGLPTAVGRLSYAVRWHGERPALLWELEPPDDPAVADALVRLLGGPVRLSAPGLDPTWSTHEARGEALLERPPLADQARVEADGATGADAAPAPVGTPAAAQGDVSPAGPVAEPVRRDPAPDDGGSFS